MPRLPLRAVIRHEHPYATPIKIGLIALGLLIAFGLGLLSSGRVAGPELVPMVSAEDELREELDQLRARHDIDLATIQTLRSQFAEEIANTEELEAELQFYREVMAPEEIDREVVLRKPVFKRLPAPNTWQFEIVVQRGGKAKTAQRGKLRLSLRGMQGGLPSIFNLQDMASQSPAELSLNFRYFQRLTGEIVLPPDFEPEFADFEAELVTPAADAVSASYQWGDIVSADELAATHEPSTY